MPLAVSRRERTVPAITLRDTLARTCLLEEFSATTTARHNSVTERPELREVIAKDLKCPS